MATKFATDMATGNLDAVSVRRIDVTPELAEKWLRSNKSNRKLRKGVVEQYAADMIAGRWHLVGDSIKFDDDVDNYPGNLLDGQHRLQAIVSSGTVQPMMVITGLTPDSQKYMDSGIKRNAGDQFDMDGRRYGVRLAAATREILRIEDQQMHRKQSYSNAAVVDFFRANQAILDAVLMVDGIRRVTTLAPAGAATVAFYGNMVRPDETRDFFSKLLSGVGLKTTDPELLLRNRLTDVGSMGLDRLSQLWLTFRALNMRLEGIDTHTRLQLPKGPKPGTAGVVSEKNRLLSNGSQDANTNVQGI
jgi:hypothetical protein